MTEERRPPGTAAVWTSPDGSRRFYTRLALRWVFPGMAWFFALIAVAGPAQEFEFYDSWYTGAPFVLVALGVAGYVTYAARRCGVLVEPGRLTNRRMLWTNRVPAHDIARFEPPPAYGGFRRNGLRIVLRDGRVLSATAFTKGKIDGGWVGVAETAELNQWLEGQRRVEPPLY